jgi:phage/plasmid-like protein (TIGR03299 family)
MSHGIRTHEDGRATIVVVDEGAWHGLVKPVKGPISMEEGIRLAHLNDLEYHPEPLYAPVPGKPGQFMELDNRFTTVARNPFTRGWEVPGGAYTADYVMHTVEDIHEFGTAILGEGFSLSALGMIDDGRRMFASFKIRDYNFGGDKSFAWMNLYTDFTGGMASIFKPGATRVVCKNTFHIGLSEKVEMQFRARHTGQRLPDRVVEARQALGFTEQALDGFEVEVQRMLDAEVTERKFEQIVAQFIPIDKDATDTIKFKREVQRDTITKVWKSGNAKNISGTAWGSYNALTEYIDWTGGSYRSDEARFVASLTPGSSMDRERARALQIVRQLVKV